MAITLLLSVTIAGAQIKNATTETVKIYGNCGMCKTTIETAGNLKKVAIPSKVEEIANNPFAGCPLLSLENHSKNFKLVDDVLFDKKKTILIYYSISKKNEKYKIPYIKIGCLCIYI